jgi:GAF domain-containing protein
MLKQIAQQAVVLIDDHRQRAELTQLAERILAGVYLREEGVESHLN